jgi:adenine deaminase
MKVSGNIVDVLRKRIFPGTIRVLNGKIAEITEDNKTYNRFITPGFIDAHIHIESSILTPSEFARIAVVHGTIATVSDPHEIANVLGLDGVKFMVNNGKSVPFKFFFGAPSCVPASPFETSGASLGPHEIEALLANNEIKFLGEVMNVPGVLNQESEVMRKITTAQRYKKAVDGHAPGLIGRDLVRYIKAGISTDHEAVTLDEAVEKLSLGMKLLIREGSAARSLDTFAPLIDKYTDYCMFCSDDKHPHDLAGGHINEMIKRAAKSGIDTMKVLRCACVNPVLHYNLPIGLLRTGDPADFLVIDDFKDLTVLQTYIDGTLVAQEGKTLISSVSVESVNNFKSCKKVATDFAVKKGGDAMRVIEAIDGELITGSFIARPKTENGFVIEDTSRDILKIAVVNRYADTIPAVGFVRNFGLLKGAIASSVAHDSHNIVVVGVSDESICRAVNLIIRHRGGIALIDDDREEILPLPVAGIMTHEDGWSVARRYAELDQLAKGLGSKLRSPFMTLSFMALPVIPKLKLTDRGLFDGKRFAFTRLFVE